MNNSSSKKLNLSNSQLIEYQSNPGYISFFRDLTNDSYSSVYSVNAFSIFKSINNVLYLIYTISNNSIISFNIIRNEELNEIKNAHNKNITYFKHYLDDINKRDLIMSISTYDNNIKIWDIYNWENILDIKKVNNLGRLYSASFLKDNNNIYIITSNDYIISEKIKVYDLKGNKIKEINDSNEPTFFIDVYYDDKLNKKYIISGNERYIKSYDYEINKVYNIYNSQDNYYHSDIIIYDKEKIIKLIESSWDGNIRIWSFHSGELLNTIQVCTEDSLLCIDLWNRDYLFVGCSDKTIKLIDLKIGKTIKNLQNYNDSIITIKKFKHPDFGECLISQGFQNEQIKLWKFAINF